MPKCPLNFTENKNFGKIRLKIRFKQISNKSLNPHAYHVDGWPNGSDLGLQTGRSNVQAMVPPLDERVATRVCHVDLDLGGSPCGMPGGTLLLVLLLVYNSVSTKLAKSTKKGANFC